MGRPKLTPAEKARRKAQRQADAVNARELRAVGPLFAHLATEYTPEQAAQRAAFVRAGMIEHLHNTPAGPGYRALQWVQVQQIEDYARGVCGELFGPFRAAMHRTYGRSVGYFYTFWCQALTGEPVLYGYERTEDAAEPLGCRVRKLEAALSPAPLTREEFHARFPYVEPTHYAEGETPEAAELFRSVMHRLGVTADA